MNQKARGLLSRTQTHWNELKLGAGHKATCRKTARQKNKKPLGLLICGSALHERDHRGGDHPIPFRTRQLSPPSPKVLQRQAAGGQGVALMQGASAYIRGLCPFFVTSFKAPFTRKYRRCGGFIMRPYFSELQYNSIVSRIQRGWIDEQLAYSRGRRPA